MKPLEFNILIGKTIESDKELFFGPLSEEDEFLSFEDQNFGNLLAQLGLFPSAGQAKKNGWNKDIPEGFTDLEVGKLKTRIVILKITEDFDRGEN